MQIMQVALLPHNVQRGIADDNVDYLAAQKRLDTEAIVEQPIGKFDPAALGIGPDVLDGDHEEIVPDGGEGRIVPEGVVPGLNRNLHFGLNPG
jgi:hypothetical protein